MIVKVVQLRNHRGGVRWAVREYDDSNRMVASAGRYRSQKRAERAAKSRVRLWKRIADTSFYISTSEVTKRNSLAKYDELLDGL